MSYLGIADASGIQNYMFRRSELREIAAASKYVEDMCKPGGVYERTAQAHGCKVIMAAGGNASFYGTTEANVKAVMRDISCELLKDGTGLEIVACVMEYPDGKLAANYSAAMQRLDRLKLTQPRSARSGYPGLEEIWERRQPPLSPLRPQSGWVLPVDLGLMIGNEEDVQADLMAVVSIDGLGMGKRLIQWMKEQSRKETSDDDFCANFKLWSRSIQNRWAEAWENGLQLLERAFVPNTQQTPEMKHTSQEKRLALTQIDDVDNPLNGKFVMPCRRIYQGGDDLSFVCDARIALSLTAFIMTQLETLPVETGVDPLFRAIPSSAGVLFVDSHFPFIRAVHLSEDVRKDAKKRANELQIKDNLPPSVMDWWLNRQGAMRRPDPDFPGATLKPYALHDAPYSSSVPFSFDHLQASVFPAMWQQFAGSRNKLKDLLAAAETGDASAVKRQMHLRPLRTPDDKPKHTLDFVAPFAPETGFSEDGNRTVLLDILEIFDIHFPFPPAFINVDTVKEQA